MNTHQYRLVSSLLLACGATAAMAGSVQVTVKSADGKPVADTVVLLQPTASWTPQPLPAPAVIAQKDIKFMPYVSVVPVGGTVRFVNKDAYDHHVRSLPGGPLGTVAPAKQFEIRMPAAAGGKEASNDLKMDVPGVIALGCHLHGSMRGHVFVSLTPWYAVTDANGRATVEGVPEGQAELRLWHPDQLTDQAPVQVQVAAAPLSAEAKLNFTPRRRNNTPAARDSNNY
ncbi:plastocyanin [Ideonella sp. BN130291]|uniref:plastocyanin n=1 Tax=Ideonella sp. BN130291 TaxID=3112940 RepID=UPI002E25A1FF|nr:plastocyanin [Ideonella sp. BN130291]